MCRNIKKLRRDRGVPTDEELYDAALQFVRKISGFRKPSKANEKSFERAVRGVTRVSQKMFDELVIGAQTKRTTGRAPAKRAAS